MEKLLSQLQTLQNIFTQWQASITAQQHHLTLLIHIIQTHSNNVALSDSVIEESINNIIQSNAEIIKAINNTVLSLEQIEISSNNVTLSNVEKELDTEHNVLSNTEKRLDTKHITLSNAEKELDINKVSNGLLKQKLAEILPNRSKETKQNAIKIIFALHQNPKQTHQDLIKITQLSKGGLNKHLMMLKKQNIIERCAYQEYKPTSFILGIMKECMQ